MNEPSQLAHLHGKMGSCSTELSRCPRHACWCYVEPWQEMGPETRTETGWPLWEQAETRCLVLSFNDAPGTGCQVRCWSHQAPLSSTAP